VKVYPQKQKQDSSIKEKNLTNIFISIKKEQRIKRDGEAQYKWYRNHG